MCWDECIDRLLVLDPRPLIPPMSPLVHVDVLPVVDVDTLALLPLASLLLLAPPSMKRIFSIRFNISSARASLPSSLFPPIEKSASLLSCRWHRAVVALSLPRRWPLMESSSRDSRKRVGLSSSGQSSGWMRRELGDGDGDDDGDEDQTSAYSSAGNKLAIRDLEAAEAVIVLWRRLPALLAHPTSCSAPQVYALHARDRELLLFAWQVANRTADDAAPCAVLVLVLDCRADDDQLAHVLVGSALRFAAILLGMMARDAMIRCDMLCCVSS